MADTGSLNPTILICDDETLLVAALERSLRRRGARAVCVTSPNQVLEAAARYQPHLILLDLRFDKDDGRDLLAQLKSDPRTRHIQVVMLSSETDQFTRHVCFGLGALDYEVKPFDQIFIEKMLRLAQRAAAETSSRSQQA